MNEASHTSVLVVDDEPDILEATAMVLENVGYHVITARNGLEALDAMRRTHPSLVLLDLMMPVMDGWEFRNAQLADPCLAETPVVIITGGGISTRTDASLTSAAAVLEKPLSIDQLVRAVHDHSAPAHHTSVPPAATNESAL